MSSMDDNSTMSYDQFVMKHPILLKTYEEEHRRPAYLNSSLRMTKIKCNGYGKIKYMRHNRFYLTCNKILSFTTLNRNHGFCSDCTNAMTKNDHQEIDYQEVD